MIQLKSAREIEIMARGGQILAGAIALVEREMRAGMTTLDVDKLVEDFIRSHPGAMPSFKGLYGFPEQRVRVDQRRDRAWNSQCQAHHS